VEASGGGKWWMCHNLLYMSTNINILIYIIYMNRVEQMKLIQQEAFDLFTKKNIDYGDAFAKYGVIGVLMRIEDKLHRSMSITKNGVNLINDEGLRDTLIDLHNYAAMALMLLDE
jgi:hypothetical protein